MELGGCADSGSDDVNREGDVEDSLEIGVIFESAAGESTEGDDTRSFRSNSLTKRSLTALTLSRYTVRDHE